MKQNNQLNPGPAPGASAGAGVALGAALLLALGAGSSATAAQANLTTADRSEVIARVVSELAKIPGPEAEVANKVQQLKSQADALFLQSTNTALSVLERNRNYALGLNCLAKATIEADKFARFKGGIISNVKGQVATIQGSEEWLSPLKVPAVDLAQLAAQNRQADQVLARVTEGETVPQEQVDELLMAKAAVSDVEGLSNDSLTKFQGDLRSLCQELRSEEFNVAQSTVVNRRVLTWIQIKALQGQLGLTRGGANSVPAFTPKDIAGYATTLVKFSPPREERNGAAAAESKSPRVAATTAFLQ